MKIFFYLRVELNRIFHSKIVYLIITLTMLCPMVKHKLYAPEILSDTLSSHFIRNSYMAVKLKKR